MGINFTDKDPLVPPLEKLQTALGDRLNDVQPQPPLTVPCPSPSPAPQPKPPMSRLELIRTLSQLGTPDFNALMFSLNAPSGNIPPSSAAPGDRAFALLQWAEGPTGCGLDKVEEELRKLLPQ